MEPVEAARIGAQVRRARKISEWTTQELADAAGVAQGTVVRIENGRPVRPGNLRAVLDSLGIPAISETVRDVDEDVRLALDLVEKTLMAVPVADRGAEVRALIRYLTLRDGAQG